MPDPRTYGAPRRNALAGAGVSNQNLTRQPGVHKLSSSRYTRAEMTDIPTQGETDGH